MTALTEIDELADTIERRMAGRSGVVFLRPKISFARITAPTRIPVDARAGIAVLAQGSKRLHVVDRSYHSNGSQYLVSTTALRGEVEVLECGPQKPLLGMTVDFEWPRLHRLLMDVQDEPNSDPPARDAWVAGEVDRSVARALLHVARLACSDREWEVLGEGALRELYYWALRSEAGRVMRVRAARRGGLEGVRRAVRFVESHLTDRLDVATIAKAAAMSPSGLHARFSETLGQSPMQFVKQLRLENARGRIAGGESVTTAALEVGYASPSQFSRDFARHFGVAPSRVRGAARNGAHHGRISRGREG